MDWVRCSCCHADLEFGVAVLDAEGNWVCPPEMLADCLADMASAPRSWWKTLAALADR